MKHGLLLSTLLLALESSMAHAGKTPSEDDYYRLHHFELPKGEVIEPGALEFFADGKLAVGTRRGEVWLVHDAMAMDIKAARLTRYAHGLHEVLGLGHKDGWLYATQRCDLSRIKDSKGKGRADLFEVVADGWEISGDYHEYAFGSRFDKDGNIWIVLCLTGSFSSSSKYRGWCVKVTPQGKMVPVCSGVRSPGGIGMNADGDMFYTDNQGPWNGTCSLKHLVPGGFVGHPDSFKWYAEVRKLNADIGPTPLTPKSGSRFMTEAKRIEQFIPPAVLFPYQKMGQSASGIDCDLSEGKFGPFHKQLFVGDQTHSTVMRVFLEKMPIDGKTRKWGYQGVCFPFRQGFGTGVVPVRFGPDGSLFAGCSSRGWPSRGTKPFSLDRVVWSGKVPFEIHEMRAKHDGFELSFTQPVDRQTAADPASYTMRTYTYIYQAAYGSPEVDHTKPDISRVEVAKDARSVRLYVSKLQEGHVHELAAAGVRSAAGLPLLHREAYYTLNWIPAK